MALKNSLERLTIGQLANLAGMGIETIRFYERKGIITRPARPASGFRVYSKDVVARLTCVREAQEMGFTLREIIDLLALRDDPSTDAAAMRGRATAKLAQIQNKIDRLVPTGSGANSVISRCSYLRTLGNPIDPACARVARCHRQLVCASCAATFGTVSCSRYGITATPPVFRSSHGPHTLVRHACGSSTAYASATRRFTWRASGWILLDAVIVAGVIVHR